MGLIQLLAPDLSTVSVGIPSLQYLNSLGFSDDGRFLLVQATFTDSYDPNGSDLRYAVWVYDVVSGQYTTCLNSLVAGSANAARETDILSASFAGGTSAQPNILVHSAIDDVDQSDRLSLVSPQGALENVIASVLGADVWVNIQDYAVSQGGRFVAIQTDSTHLSEFDTNSTSDIYLLDLQSRSIERVSLLAGAETFSPAVLGSITVSGSTVSVNFTTEASFARNDTNASQLSPEARTDAYNWSRSFTASGFSGAPSVRLLSQGINGTASGGVSSPDYAPVSTASGILFTSSAPNLVAGDTNAQADIFNFGAGNILSRVTLPGRGQFSAGAALAGASNDGRVVALLTTSEEVAGPEQNQQLVLLDQIRQKWVVASSGPMLVGNDMVVSATLSPNGDAVAFVSFATNLTGQAPTTLGGSLFLLTGINDTFDNKAVGSASVTGTMAEGGVLQAEVVASDPDGSISSIIYEWQISSNAQSGWTTIDGATSSNFVIAADQSQIGKFLRVVATTIDPLGGRTVFTSVPVSQVANVNDVPVGLPQILGTQGGSPAGGSDFTENKRIYADASLVSDSDGLGVYRWQWQRSVDGGTTWSDIPAATQDSYVLGDADVGRLVRLTLAYTDGQGTQETLYSAPSSPVVNVNDAPVVASAIADQISAEDTAWSFVVPAGTFSDVDSATLTLSAMLGNGNPLPDWLTFNAATGTFSGTPPLNFTGTLDLKVTASDGTLSVSDTFTLSVSAVNDAPVGASVIADQISAQGAAWSYQFAVDAFSDVDGDSLTYSATLAGGGLLPGWLSFDAATRTFSGAPPQDFIGDISLTVTASDGSLSASDTFVLTIEPPLQFVAGTSGNDTLTGIAGSVSEITGGGGNDTITGGSRADVAVYSGNSSDYTITTLAGVTTVRDNRTGSPDGTDTLRGMNILRFADLQLFQTAAANKVKLAGQAQTYAVVNSEVVQGTNAAEHFIVAPKTSSMVFAGNNDVVDLSGAIDSYSYTATGTQLQISDGSYTTTLSVGGSFTLRTASGSTSVAIDFTQGGAIKLGGTQVVGSATFDPIAAILDPSNVPNTATSGSLQPVTGTSGNDTLTGIAGSVSEITGGGGNDTITGGSRADVAVYSGNSSDYTITTLAGVTTVRDNRTGSPDGTDTLRGMNILRFADLQLFQTAAANKVTLAGQAQTYAVVNSEVVQGTNAAEHFIVAPKTSSMVFAGNNDVVDLSGAIDSYSYTATGTQLQISDGSYTTTLSVGGSFTLRTASGSTSVAIDFTQGGAIKLGGTQVVGSATFDPIAAILDPENYSDNAEFRQITVNSDGSYNGHEGIVDVFVIYASQTLTATIVGFEDGDRIVFKNRTAAQGALFDPGASNDGIATLTAGTATLQLTGLASDAFTTEASFETIYGIDAIGYLI